MRNCLNDCLLNLLGDVFDPIQILAERRLRTPHFDKSNINIILALHHRSVIVPSDEPLLSATSLGLDIRTAPQSFRSREMQSAVEANILSVWMDTIPQCRILFMGPQLTETGFRRGSSTLPDRADNLRPAREAGVAN